MLPSADVTCSYIFDHFWLSGENADGSFLKKICWGNLGGQQLQELIATCCWWHQDVLGLRLQVPVTILLEDVSRYALKLWWDLPSTCSSVWRMLLLWTCHKRVPLTSCHRTECPVSCPSKNWGHHEWIQMHLQMNSVTSCTNRSCHKSTRCL